MKRKFSYLLTIVLLSVFLCACGGKVGNVEIVIGDSEFFEEKEIESAMQVVIRFFGSESGFRGCTMTDLSYDEERSLAEAAEWAKSYDEDEAIVLISRFTVGPNGNAEGTLTPNAAYPGWKWILVRSDKGKWKLVDWGY